MYKITYILTISLLFIATISVAGQPDENKGFKLLTPETQFDAGDQIVLEFFSNHKTAPSLYCSNSHGTILITPVVNNSTLRYDIPKDIAKKTGLVNWKLVTNHKPLSGKFFINPKPHPNTMETYLGPPSIEAGGLDYTMLVVIPTDVHDNPLKEGTAVNAKHQFSTSIYNDLIYTNNLIAFKNIHSKPKSGRMLVSSETLEKNSKEYTVNVVPAIPTNFEISYGQDHNYADGNQITTFKTSTIRDKYGNIVSDGTYVNFFVTNGDQNILKTAGATINGTAIAKMVHPDHEDSWTVKAFIEGMAESNIIALDFKQVIKDFEVVFSKNNRTISVGPLQSFMKQMIPDGMQVKLHIYQEGVKFETYLKETFEGVATFKLNDNEVPSNRYSFVIETANIEKKFENLKL